MIIKDGSRWCVKSEDGSKSFGCYDTKQEAEERLKQIHFFKEVGKEMDKRHKSNK